MGGENCTVLRLRLMHKLAMSCMRYFSFTFVIILKKKEKKEKLGEKNETNLKHPTTHVTCHVSHVVCHMLLVMCHMSSVTCRFFLGGGAKKDESRSLYPKCNFLNAEKIQQLKLP